MYEAYEPYIKATTSVNFRYTKTTDTTNGIITILFLSFFFSNQETVFESHTILNWSSTNQTPLQIHKTHKNANCNTREKRRRRERRQRRRRRRQRKKFSKKTRQLDLSERNRLCDANSFSVSLSFIWQCFVMNWLPS